MKKNVKGHIRRIIVGTLLGSCLCMMPYESVSANTLMDLVYTDEETDADYAEAYNTPKARGAYLSYGVASIEKESNDEVLLYGLTQGHVVCDTVSLSMSLERKVDGSYGTYKMWDFYDYNKSFVMQSLYVLVPKGSFYRLRTYHSAKVGITRESTSTVTKGIYIGDDA